MSQPEKPIIDPRVEANKKSFEEAKAWVEKTTHPDHRCLRCGGVGLEEKEPGVYEPCAVCKGGGARVT